MNSKTVGDISEAYVTAKFLSLGYVVLKPFGDNQRYDLVIDRGNGFETVQVKTANFKDDFVKFECRSSYTHRGNGKKSYYGQADLFAVYCSKLNQIYLISVNKAPASSMVLRLNKSKNNQKSNVNYASDYVLE